MKKVWSFIKKASRFVEKALATVVFVVLAPILIIIRVISGSSIKSAIEDLLFYWEMGKEEENEEES